MHRSTMVPPQITEVGDCIHAVASGALINSSSPSSSLSSSLSSRQLPSAGVPFSRGAKGPVTVFAMLPVDTISHSFIHMSGRFRRATSPWSKPCVTVVCRVLYYTVRVCDVHVDKTDCSRLSLLRKGVYPRRVL